MSNSEKIQQHRICGIDRFGPWESPWRNSTDPNPQYLMEIATKPGNMRVWVERRTVTYSNITKSRDVEVN
jgi:hypothetical protein